MWPSDRAAWRLVTDPDRPILERVKAIFHYNRFNPDPHLPDKLPAPFHSEGFRYANEGGPTIIYGEENAVRIRSFCTELLDLIDESPLHTSRLDTKFSELLQCHFQPTGNSSPLHDQPSLDLEVEITKRTIQLSDRLPKTLLQLSNVPSGLPSIYYSCSTERKDSHTLSWHDLRVASYVSVNVIRVAMCTIIHPWISKGKIPELINHVAELLDVAAQLCSSSKTSAARYRWFMVMSFIWASWQHSVMIYFSYLLAQHLETGVDDGVSSSAVFLPSFWPVSDVSLQDGTHL